MLSKTLNVKFMCLESFVLSSFILPRTLVCSLLVTLRCYFSFSPLGLPSVSLSVRIILEHPLRHLRGEFGGSRDSKNTRGRTENRRIWRETESRKKTSSSDVTLGPRTVQFSRSLNYGGPSSDVTY